MIRLACVSYLNSRPLVHGLENDSRVKLSFAVPSLLLDELLTHRADIALLPVIDILKVPGAQVLSAGGIGCDGPTLTVRLFSRKPLEQTTVVGADPDSHTSVALSKLIFARRFGLSPRYVEPTNSLDTLLLIGDKVITRAPLDMPFQLDLGQAWKELTGLPFVFAIWTARQDVQVDMANALLTESRLQGMQHIESILVEHALPRGWPIDIARQYLTQYLNYAIGPTQLRAIDAFHRIVEASDLTNA
jgi:chorismate dehydratase